MRLQRVYATGVKFNYCLINDIAKNMSYKPKVASLNGIIEQKKCYEKQYD